MYVDDLEEAIEYLLEGQPNQDKPVRKRRDKERDLKKAILRGDRPYFSAFSTQLREYIQKTRLPIDTVHVTVTEDPQAYHYGTSKRGYEVLNSISKETGVPTNKLYLSKQYRYNYHTEEFEIEKWGVYERGYRIRLDFVDEEGKRVWVKGFTDIHGNGNVVRECVLTTGVYQYSEVKDYLEGLFNRKITPTIYKYPTVKDVAQFAEDTNQKKIKAYTDLYQEYSKNSLWTGKLYPSIESRLRKKDDLKALVHMYNNSDDWDELDEDPHYHKILNKVTASRKELDPQDYWY